MHDTRIEESRDGWYASCSCGWEANNPLPSREAAEDSVRYHSANTNDPQGLGVKNV